MNIETRQNPDGRWSYLLVARNGIQMGYSMYDYATEAEARKQGDAFIAEASKSGPWRGDPSQWAGSGRSPYAR